MDLLEIAVSDDDDDDGDNNEYRYVPGRSTAILFCQPDVHRDFFYLHRHVLQQKVFLTPNCTKILGASMGLILTCPPYAVINPFMQAAVHRPPIPTTMHTNPFDPHALVAFGDGERGLVYYIVCAFLVERHFYKLNTFSSHDKKWRYGRSSKNLGDIVENSGVSCERRAYWLTKRPLPMVLCYDVSDRSHEFFQIPQRLQANPCQLQLGTRGGNRLILLAAMADEMSVHTLTGGQQHREWQLSFQQGFSRRTPPVPIRSQSRMLQALFWLDNFQLLIWENRWDDESHAPRIRSLQYANIDTTLHPKDFVSVIETTLHPRDFCDCARLPTFTQD